MHVALLCQQHAESTLLLLVQSADMHFKCHAKAPCLWRNL